MSSTELRFTVRAPRTSLIERTHLDQLLHALTRVLHHRSP
jgi:hypothetical protein